MTTQTEERFHIGVDIGGTFTDVVLLDADGALRTKKVLSTPDDYSRGVVQGVLELLQEAGAEPAAVTKVVHATTVASNAVLEGKGSAFAGAKGKGKVEASFDVGSLGLGSELEAEGKAGQVEALRAHGCTNVQGFLFSRPVPATTGL